MSDQGFVIDLGSDQRAVVEPDDRAWLEEKLRREPGSTRLSVRTDESDDTEGHSTHGKRIRVIAGDDEDTEGHAIALNFPTKEEADAFRKRLMIAGVLAGTIALGTAGGIGLANLSSQNADNAGAVQSSVSGSDWTQAERPATITDSVGGSAWSQDERPGAAANDAGGASLDDVEQQVVRGPQPR